VPRRVHCLDPFGLLATSWLIRTAIVWSIGGFSLSNRSNPHASSTGHAYAGVAWLDARYEASRAAYESQVRMAGLQPGWHVLDAGCGSGSYLPLLAELVGPTGQLSALDLAEENIATVEERLQGWGLDGRVSTCVGSVVALPYPDDSFDAVWCANTSQYLTDAELEAALGELGRVVRPGGLIAIKESDATRMQVMPAPVGIMLRAYLAGARAGGVVEGGMIRAASLPAWLRRAGLTNIRRHTTLLEHAAPLSGFPRHQWWSLLGFLAERTADADVPHEDRAFWAPLREGGPRDRLLDDPDFSGCEGNTLAVGTVPG
jgi:arsenite methyltransferase